MEKKDLARIQKYHDLLKGSEGQLDVLSLEEQQDLKRLLEKSQVEQGSLVP